MQYESCVIFAKGPTFRNEPRKYENELRICINHTAIFIDDIDIVLCNDMESINDILEKKPDISCTFYIPAFPHIRCKPGPYALEYDFLNAMYKKGKLVMYNLLSSKKQLKELETMVHQVSSLVTTIEVLNKWFPEIKHITTYGFANGLGYHEYFQNDYNYTRKKRKGCGPGKRMADKFQSIKELLQDNVEFMIV